MSLHHKPHPSSNNQLPSSSSSSTSSSSSSSTTTPPSASSSQGMLYPCFHDPPSDQIGSTPTSIINPNHRIPSSNIITTSNNSNTTITTTTTSTPITTTTAITNLNHQPLEWYNYTWSTTQNQVATQASNNSATASSSPASILNLNTLDNTDSTNNLFLRSRNQPTDITLKTDLSPSSNPLPPIPSSSSSSSPQSSSSSPSANQKTFPLFDPNQIGNMMTHILPLSANDNFPNQLSTIHSNYNNINNNQNSSSYVGNHYGSRPSTAPSASFWSNPNNSNTLIEVSSPTPNTSTSATLSSTNLADLSFDDAFKSFPYQSHHNLPSVIPNLNQLVPPSQPHSTHPSMMMNTPQELLSRHDLSHFNDLISSPHSPSAARLLTHNPFHPHHLPIQQHPYNPLSPTPIEHQTFPLQVHHVHPHLGAWHPSFDPVHLATCYDPFQIKHRRRTTPNQLSVLEAQFQTNCKPDVSLRKSLADQLDMTPREVQVWFQNRRAKTKKLERRAEQESGKPTDSDSIPSLSRPTTSPPASVYLSPTSLRGLALPVTHESPEEARIGVSPPRVAPSVVNPISEIDEGGRDIIHHVESDRRSRSRSLLHHPYHIPSLNAFNVPTIDASNSFTGVRMPNQQQQLADGSDDSTMDGRRSSQATNLSSTTTATDPNVLCTPTATEFDGDYTTELPNGYDPRRRSSCPAEFIQSFGHFGLAINQSLDHHTGLQSCFIPANQTCEPVNEPVLDAGAAPFTMLAGHNEEWIKQHGYRNDAVRDGIQRRHSLATMNSPTESQEHSLSPNSTAGFNSGNGLTSLISMGASRYTTPVLSGVDANQLNAIKPHVSRGGYVRRASTSVLKSIEEHPGNI